MLEKKTADSVLEWTVAGCGHTQRLGLGANVYTEGPAFLPAIPSWTGSIMDFSYPPTLEYFTADTRLRRSFLGSCASHGF